MSHYFHHRPHQEWPGIETKLLGEIVVNNCLTSRNVNWILWGNSSPV